MAEATGIRNNALPYPIYAAPFAIVFPLLDADGDPISPSSPDSERSLNGDTFADCTNEATEIATSTGVCYLLLTGAEMTADVVAVRIQSTGAKTTVVTLHPRKLATVHSGTAADDGSGVGDIVLDSAASTVDDFYNGMVCIATIDGNIEARIIDDYVGSTKTASVTPDWNVAVDNTDTFIIALPEGFASYVHTVKTYSDTTIIYSDTTTIQSDVTTLASDLAEGDFSDILSRLTVTNSQVLIIKSDTSDIKSHLTVLAANISDINSDTNAIFTTVSDIQSDTNKLVSDATEVDASDILSLLTLVRSDTAVIEAAVSDIQSDTNVLITKMRGVVLATGTIGATGNTTTVIHIPDGVLDSLSDDEINGYGVVIYDVSLDEYHVRTILDWTNVGDLATVSTLPFTPEASVDLYWILPPYAQQFEYDNSDIVSLLTLVRSDTAVIETVISDVQSDTNKLVSDATEVDTSDLMSMLTLIRSDTTAIEGTVGGAEGDISDALVIIASDAAAIDSNVDKVYSDTTAIEAAGGALTAAQDSKLTEINSQVVRIHSDTITLASDLAEGDFSDVLSRLVVTNSLATKIYSDTTTIQSDVTTLASDLAEADFSDIHSRLTVVLSDTSDIRSHLTAMTGAAGIISDIGSGVDAIQAAGAALTAAQDSKLTQIHSDTQPVGTLFEIVSDIYSDTTAIEAGGGALTATQASQLARVQSIAIVIEPYTSDTVSMVTVIKSDTSDIISALVKVYSDTAAIDSNVDKVYSDTTKIDTQTLDIQSETEVIQSLAVAIEAFASDTYSDTTAIHSLATKIDSDQASQFAIIEPYVSDIYSDTAAIHTQTTKIDSDQASQFVILASQYVVLEQNTSDTESALVKIYSDTTAIEAGGGALTVAQDSKLTKVNSGTIVIKSDVAQLTFTVPGKVDANIEYVNGTEVTGAGSEADPWGP
jgi:hypothetical protein